MVASKIEIHTYRNIQ